MSRIRKIRLIPLFVIPMVAALFTFGSSEKSLETSAYTGADLPTTIDLKDPNESTVRNYYSNLDNLAEGERKGNNLLKNLKTILSNGQKYYNYDSGDLVWKMYEITDRDWDKSPAGSDSVGSYNSTTKVISNYRYGSNSSHTNNPYVRAYYMDRGQENVVHAWGNHTQDGTGINREHLWAKAEGFDSGGAAGARGDPMHLVAANGYANNIHKNHFYGYVDRTRSYEDVKDRYSTLGHNYSGYSKSFPDSNVTVFEPQDCDKGDIARAIFYMAARYNNIAGKTASQETFDADNPNLLLTNDLSKWTSSGYTSTATNPGYHGLINDLLEWNRIDKPDAYEIHRNNLLFTNFTNNRNPFIDFPEWADYIWGNQSSPASPASDPLNGGGGSQEVVITSIEVTKKPNKLVYTVGESLDLTGMVVIAHKSDGTYETLNSTQYTVSPTGALKLSDKTVTVSFEDKTCDFAIAVQNRSGGPTEDLSVSFNFTSCPDGWPSGSSDSENTQVYKVGGVNYSFDLGKNVYYNTSKYLMLKSTTYLGLPVVDGYKLSKVVVKNSSGCSASTKVGISKSKDSEKYLTGGDAQTFATTSGTYTYTLANSEVDTKYYLYITSANCQIIGLDLTYSPIANVPVTGITLDPTSSTLEVGQSLLIKPTIAPENATVQLVSWTSSSSSVATVNDNGRVTAVGAGSATITCSALDSSGITATCIVTVEEPVVLQSISLSGDYPTEFYLNDEFSNTGMVVTAHYSDGSQADVTDEAECTGFNPTQLGTQTITVSYGGVSTKYTVTVKESKLEDNQRLFVASKSGVGNGEELTSYTDEPVTISFSKNSGSTTPKYYNNTQSYRVYGGNTFTVSGTKKITKIELEMANDDGNSITSNVGNFSGTTWTGNDYEVVFTIGGTSGHRNIVSVKVTYDENSQELAVLSSISLSGTYKTGFFTTDEFTYEGLVVTAHYSNGTFNTVTPTSVSSPLMTLPGEKTITVSYTENHITRTATYSITVSAPVATSIELTGDYQTEFEVDDEFNTDGMIVVEHFNNETTKDHSPSECTITGYNMSTVGEQTVTVSYGSNSTTYTIIVKNSGKIILQKSVNLNIQIYAKANNWENGVQYSTINANNDITITAVKSGGSGGNTGKYYTTGNNWRIYQNESPELTIKAPSNGKIKAITITYTLANTGILTYDDVNIPSGQEVTLNSRTAVFSVGNTGTATNGQVLITDIKVDYELAVDPPSKPVASIALSGDYKTSFTVGDEFEFGGTVTATYVDETTEDVTSSAFFSGYDLYTAGTQTVTVTYGEKSTTYQITVVDPNSKNFYKVSGDLISGDYLMGYTDIFANAVIGSNKFGASTLTNTNNVVSTSQSSNIFHIDVCDGYVTIFSKSENKYIAGTGANSQIKFETTVTDNAKWEVEKNSTNDGYCFTNISNRDSEKSAIFRGNQKAATYFACYANGDALNYLSLYRLENSAYVQAEDLSWIQEGDHIAFGANDFGSFTAQNTNNLISGNAIYPTENAAKTEGNYVIFGNELMDYEVHIENGYYTFECELGYLSAIGDSVNVQYLSTVDDELSKFTLAEVNGTKAFKCLSYDRYIKWTTVTSGIKIGLYGSSSSYTPVTVLVDKENGEAYKWSSDFLKSTYGCTLDNWNNFGTLFNGLSNEAKTAIKDSAGDQFSSNVISQAMARYDYILGDPRFEVSNFITDRPIYNTNTNRLFSLENLDNATLIVIVFVISGLVVVGGYFFLKKRKTNHY